MKDEMEDLISKDIAGNYKSYFEEDLNSIDNEIEKLDELFNDMKTDKETVFNQVFNSRSRSAGSPLVFGSNMYANMVACKNAKISLLKDRIATKRLIAELNIKSKKTENDEDMFSGIAKSIMKEINDSGNMLTLDMTNENQKVNLEDEDKLALMAAQEYKEKTGKEFNPQKSESEYEYLYLIDVNSFEIFKTDLDYEEVDEQLDEDDFVVRVRNGKFLSGFYKPTHQKLIPFDKEKGELIDD